MAAQHSILRNLVTICLVVSACTASNPKSNSQIHKQAENFLLKKEMEYAEGLNSQRTYRAGEIQSLYDISANKLPACVVHLIPKGFLIIAEQSNRLRVIAYSFGHSWDTNGTANSDFLDFLAKDLQRRERQQSQSREWLDPANELNSGQTDSINGESPDRFYQWPEDGSTVTGGWLQTTWMQGSPYKDFCPKDSASGENCPVGCAATAMAQVVNYHRYICALKFSANLEKE